MRSWTTVEQDALRTLAPLGGPACALTFARSLKSIEHKAARLGVSLKRRSCGGNPGVTSPAVLKRVRELSDAMLCPECALRFAAVNSSGLCPKCHMDRLRQVHEEHTAEVEAQLALWASRSKLLRRRRALAKLQASLNPSATDAERVTPEAR